MLSGSKLLASSIFGSFKLSAEVAVEAFAVLVVATQTVELPGAYLQMLHSGALSAVGLIYRRALLGFVHFRRMDSLLLQRALLKVSWFKLQESASMLLRQPIQPPS